MRKTTILTILDGWGIGKKDQNNPIYSQDLKTLKYIESHYPSGALQASGIAVGLPWEERGSSEISHLIRGAGRTIYQPYPKISLSIKDGSFFKNEKIQKSIQHVKQNNSVLNIVGLLSYANNESSLFHLNALITLAKNENIPFNLHLFLDGQDSPPQSALDLIEQLPKENITSLSGRYYSMDEDEKWDRIEKCYKVLTGQIPNLIDPRQHLLNSYQRNITDNQINPTLTGPTLRPIKDNDAVIFFNFREDSSWEIVAPFINSSLTNIKSIKLNNVLISTFTRYRYEFKTEVLFENEIVKNTLSQTLSIHNKTQLKISETLRYAQITYYLNGGQEAPFKNEYRVIIPSQNTPKPEQYPALRAEEITGRLLGSIHENVFDLLIVNYPNADIIGHTGNLSAAEKAVKIIDQELSKIYKASTESNSTLIIIGSHGNIEDMVDPLTGIPNPYNTKNPVPFYLVDNHLQKSGRPPLGEVTIGIISDIAPTILELLEIPKPSDMTGVSLLPYLR